MQIWLQEKTIGFIKINNMKVTCLIVNGKIVSIYFNAGNYVQEIIDELKAKEISDIDRLDFKTDKSEEDIITFLKEKSSQK